MISFLLAAAALAFAVQARKNTEALKARLNELQLAFEALRMELDRARRQGHLPDAGTAAPAAPSEGPRPAAETGPARPVGPLSSDGRPIIPRDARESAGASEVQQPAVPQISAAGAGGGGGGAADAGAPEGPRETFEEALGGRWAVWAGGAALALGGLFLVRYSIEAGLLSPAVRIVLGGLLGTAVIAAGEWLRRTEYDIPVEALPKAHIPSILTASGTVILFGTIYAAHALYDFIGPAAAFVLLGAVGIATMLASALHGPALAGLGLIGSFVAPMLVASTVPNFWALTIYLGAVAATAYVLARTRAWLWLALAAASGALILGFLMIVQASGIPSGEGLRLAGATGIHVLAQLGLAAFFFSYEPHLGIRDDKAEPDWIAAGVLAGFAVLVVFFLSALPFQLWMWLPLATVAIGALTTLGFLRAPAAIAVSLAGLVALSVALLWPGLSEPPQPWLMMPYASGLLRLPENLSSYLTYISFATLLPALAIAVRLWRGPLLTESAAGLYGLGAVLPPLLALVLTYLRVTQFDTSIPYASAGALLAGAFAYAAAQFHKADLTYSSPAYNIATGVFAAAAIAALSFSLFAALERGYLTVALALAALGAAYVANKRDIPMLAHAVSALGVVVLGRLIWDPRIMGDGVGATPILNWLLVGYGVPAAAFAYAARLLSPRGDGFPVRIADSLAVIFTALLAFFQIRQLTNNGDVLHAGSHHVEAGLMTFTALALSYGLARLNLKKANPVFDIASIVFGVGSVAFAAFGLLLAVNPLLAGDAVSGRVIFSSLLPAYLLPGLAALFVARHARGLRPEWYTRAAGVLAVVLITMYVSLEVRHAFEGALIGLHYHPLSEAEHWAHSVAWLLLGIVFLGYGLLRQSLEARMASAALVVLAALKITLYDLAGIGGIWRALSFLCLGAVLIGIGLVYQKLIFTRPQASAPSAEPQG